jgi:hypothetical protein
MTLMCWLCDGAQLENSAGRGWLSSCELLFRVHQWIYGLLFTLMADKFLHTHEGEMSCPLFFSVVVILFFFRLSCFFHSLFPFFFLLFPLLCASVSFRLLFASSSLKSFKTIFKKAGLYSAFQRRNRTTHTQRDDNDDDDSMLADWLDNPKSLNGIALLSHLCGTAKEVAFSHTYTREQSPITINPKWGRSLAFSSKCLQFF